MIYGLIQTIQEDTSVLTNWMRGQKNPPLANDDQSDRIQVAAFRMIASFVMALGALWTLSLLAFVATIPLKFTLRLAVAVSLYALAHDVFIMSQNSTQTDFRQGFQARLFNLFRGQEAIQEERARQFTHGTFLQPLWMYIYAKKNDIV
jgi:hypothetical protein